MSALCSQPAHYRARTALVGLDGLAAAAHKLGTPLGTIALVSRSCNNPALDYGLHDDVTLMVEQTDRCRDILASLTAEDIKDPVISRLPLGALLEEAVLEIGPSDKKLHVSCQPGAHADGPVPEILRQPELIYGIGNLIANAADFAVKNVWVNGRYSPKSGH